MLSWVGLPARRSVGPWVYIGVMVVPALLVTVWTLLWASALFAHRHSTLSPKAEP
jgi:hypothetical protein